jgi:hypothetical protein
MMVIFQTKIRLGLVAFNVRRVRRGVTGVSQGCYLVFNLEVSYEVVLQGCYRGLQGVTGVLPSIWS